MTFGGIKVYHLIHLDFNKNQYRVFKYEKDRRLTSKQAWNFMFENKPVKIDDFPVNANIDDYQRIVNELDFNIKYCDRYMTFG